MELALAFLYAAGSVVCHQLPDRSFFVDGMQLPVCARCTGLYLGGLAGLAAWIFWKAARRWPPAPVARRTALAVVVAAAMPTAITVATAFAGIWDGANLVRALLAVPLGLGAGGLVAAVFTKDLR